MERLGERLKLVQCPIGLKGLCCKHCLLGPCRITDAQKGVCGASKELVIARNFLRFAAGGASAHLSHAFHLLHFLKKKQGKKFLRGIAPDYLYRKWKRIGLLSKDFNPIFEISEALHITTFGVDADPKDVLKKCLRIGLSDGYGLFLATLLEDETYGKPTPKKGELNLGVIDPKKTNIAVHGHEPMLAEALVEKAKDCSDINIVGVCCTGASVLSRHGVPLAGNVILQEDVIATGAIELMVVDTQCVMPSLSDLAECFHTKLVTTNSSCRIPNAVHLPIENSEEAKEVSKRIIQLARENRKYRKETTINKEKKEAVVGFTEESLPINEMKEELECGGKNGVIAVIGCRNPRVANSFWIERYKQLSKDYYILTTGCMGFELGAEGLLDGKHVFHLGSCVNNARIAKTFFLLAEKCGKKVWDMNYTVSCPMPITEKTFSIGLFFSLLGVDIHVGYAPHISYEPVASIFSKALKKHFNKKISFETDPENFLT